MERGNGARKPWSETDKKRKTFEIPTGTAFAPPWEKEKNMSDLF